MDLTEKEVAFGKKLAHVDKEVRDQAVGKLSVFLSQDTELEYMEMLRQWKALFYCFWLSDKPLVQQELAWNLGNMILACKGVNRGRFLQAFWETICREWSALDKHRIDKYLLLLRRVVFFSLKSLEQSSWDAELVGEYAQIYGTFPLHPTNLRIPHSVRTQVANVFIDELVRLNSEMLKEERDNTDMPVGALLEPFARFIGATTIRHLPPIIQESVFDNMVVRIAEAEEAQMSKGSDDESESEDELHDNEITSETIEKLQILVDQMSSIKKHVLDVAGEEKLTSLGRKRLHALYQGLCETFPEESDILLGGPITVREPVGAQERKRAEKFKRKLEKKTKERKEKKASLRAMIDSSNVDLDINALVNTATEEEKRKYERDVQKIQELKKKAGVENDDKLLSKKDKRAQKKKVQKTNSKPVVASEEIPELVPISEPVKAKKPRIDVRVNAGDDSWVVRDKPSTRKRALQEESEFVVKEKKQTAAKRIQP
ncbi:hypothetical protein EC988_006538, partial [Linderina pennispora]